MTTDDIIKKLRDMARYPTVMLPRDKEALSKAADLLALQALAQPAAWVGLTDEDISVAAKENVEGEDMLPHSFARAIDALLREKNGGAA